MANTIVGKILSIGQTQTFSTRSGGQFQKRELVLDCSRYDEMSGEKRPNFPCLTFSQKNCETLSSFKVGDLVEVSFVLQGRPYEKGGVTKYITDVMGYKVESRNRETTSTTPSPVASPAPAPTQPVEPAPLPF